MTGIHPDRAEDIRNMTGIHPESGPSGRYTDSVLRNIRNENICYGLGTSQARNAILIADKVVLGVLLLNPSFFTGRHSLWDNGVTGNP